MQYAPLMRTNKSETAVQSSAPSFSPGTTWIIRSCQSAAATHYTCAHKSVTGPALNLKMCVLQGYDSIIKIPQLCYMFVSCKNDIIFRSYIYIGRRRGPYLCIVICRICMYMHMYMCMHSILHTNSGCIYDRNTLLM